jgi:hypothetical protein
MRSRLFAVFLLLATSAFAQKLDLAVLGGGQISFNPNSNVGTGAVIQGNVGYRLASAPLLQLYAEVPITASFAINSHLPSLIATRDYNTLFVTPGLRLKIAPPLSPVQPYFAGGFGWARYSPESANSGLRENTTDVFQFGAGLDFRLAPFLALRTEVRDYYTGAPNIAIGFTERQHNVTAMGGLVLRF